MADFLITNKLIVFVGILIVVDILTGIIKATKTHTLKSAIFRNGGYKKFLIILIIVLAWSIDKVYFGNDILYSVSCTYYIANEMISITENIAKLGVPIPKKILSVLYSMNNDDEKD